MEGQPSPTVGPAGRGVHHAVPASPLGASSRLTEVPATESPEPAQGRDLSTNNYGEGASEEPSLWQRLAKELTLGVAAEWPHLPTFRRRWRAVTFPTLVPMYAALRLTIPLVDPGTYNQQAWAMS